MKRQKMFFKTRYVIYCILAFLLTTVIKSSMLTVNAQGLLDTKGSIRLELEDLEQENSSRAGVGFSICRIGIPRIENGTVEYTLIAEGADFQGDINQISTGENNARMAKALLTFLKEQGMTGIERKTQSDGSAVWTDLDTGMYLIWEIQGEEYGEVEPFLATIPMTESEGAGWIYDIIVYPKGEKTENIPQTPENPKTPQTSSETPSKTPDKPVASVKIPVKTRAPKTGDTVRLSMSAGCFLLSGGLCICYIVREKRRKKQLQEKDRHL